MSRRPAIPLFAKLFVLFTLVPIVELTILIALGRTMGWLPTALLILGTGVLGATLAKLEGLRVWMSVRREFSMGRFPADSMLDGLLILIGGALLIAPGLITDIVGFSTLIPPIRAVYRRAIKSRFAGSVRFMGMPGTGPMGQAAPPPVGESEPPSGSPFEDKSPFSKLKQ